MQPQKTVVLLVTLDTKGEEALYVKQLIEARGLRVLVVDPGVRDAPLFPADVPRDRVAAAVGEDVVALAEARDRGRAAEIMSRGAAVIVRGLYEAGDLDGLLVIGGGTGSAIGYPSLTALPLGVPKLIVSTRSSVDWNASLARKDVAVLFAVTDILGLNPVLRRVLSNAAGAISGMVEQAYVAPPVRPVVGVTAMGVTTAGAMICRELLLAQGYEVIVFHASGAGALSFEELIAQGELHAVLDLSPSSLPDDLCGGSGATGPHRLRSAAAAGIPQVVVPGGIDFVNFRHGAIPPQYQDRLIYYHTPTTPLMRTTPEENATVGQWMGQRVGQSIGPTAILIPTRGFSDYDHEGRVFFDPVADQAFLDALHASIGDRVPVRNIDAHVNDPAFADAAVQTLIGLIEQQHQATVASTT